MIDNNACIAGVAVNTIILSMSYIPVDLDTSLRYTFELKPWKPRRSDDQNSYFHALCGEIARLTGMDRELIKEGVKEQYGVKVEYKGHRVNKPSHLMDKVEIGDIIRGAELELAEAGGDYRNL